MKKMKRAGFTLPELIVVVAVVGLLAVLAIPLLADYETSAVTTGCRSNLRQIGLIMHTYARDREDGEFPLWQPRMFPYLLNNQFPFSRIVNHLATNQYVNETRIWVCPADMVDGPQNNITVSPAADILNMFTIGNISYLFVAGHTLGSAEHPAIAPMLADESNVTEVGNLLAGNMPALSEHDNHGAQYRNLLYLDGHVNAVTGSAVNDIFNLNVFVNPVILQVVD